MNTILFIIAIVAAIIAGFFLLLFLFSPDLDASRYNVPWEDDDE